ncbi:methyl-accepting chemotaxis protein [Desulfobotulus sp. H1]|uniref:Methyl-accepting chemotaxis protein n=1 Tax=Desulfobotulus pelophilus TaxID=2823377 RepID=A0ABT3N637_9BACT|nr:methyl-accepting chemotaxis protein [Desulfobotulus pelophilus]MCW7752909.1 methyl-accepting chemotaxis protein [Desulfobotulus pelophilus]
MAVNVRSIGFRLLSTSLLSVLIPLLAVGFIATTRSTTALTQTAAENTQGIAQDLATLMDNLLMAEVRLADAFAHEESIRALARAAREKGVEGSRTEALRVFDNLAVQFPKLGGNYQGVFVANATGQLLTGILSNGSEYIGHNIAGNDEFKKALASRKTVIGNVLYSQATKKLVLPINSPILSEKGEFLGVFATVINAEYLTNIVSTRTLGRTGYGYMLNEKGVVLAHPVPDTILKTDINNIPEMSHIVREMLGGRAGADEYVFRGVRKMAGFAPIKSTGWLMSATQDHAEFLESSRDVRNAVIFVIVISLILVGIIVSLLVRSIVNPINAAVAGLRDIAEGEGDLTMRLRMNSRDEVGELARWFNVFVEKLQGIIRDIGGGVNTLASSSTQLSSIAEDMQQGVQDVSGRAETVAAASEEISTNMTQSASALEQSSSNTNLLATASEEMSATISEIAQNAGRARQISDDASGKATRMSSHMERLKKAADAIGKVIETITEISEQVNLLALNATIEAARAGEAGKGFAVVANEIKELARQTAAASQDIREKIEDIQSTTSTTIREVGEITTVINDVSEVVGNIAAAVEEQSTAASEIAGNVSQVSRGIELVHENANQNATVVGEVTKDIASISHAMGQMTNRGNQVNESARDLSRLSESLKTMVDQFKI